MAASPGPGSIRRCGLPHSSGYRGTCRRSHAKSSVESWLFLTFNPLLGVFTQARAGLGHVLFSRTSMIRMVCTVNSSLHTTLLTTLPDALLVRGTSPTSPLSPKHECHKSTEGQNETESNPYPDCHRAASIPKDCADDNANNGRHKAEEKHQQFHQYKRPPAKRRMTLGFHAS